MTVVQAGAIVGPLLAGALIPLIGLPVLYLLDAIALLATLWATWRLPAVPPGDTEQPGDGPGCARSSTGSATRPCTRCCWCRS